MRSTTQIACYTKTNRQEERKIDKYMDSIQRMIDIQTEIK